MKPSTRILSILMPVMKDGENALKTYRSLRGILGDEIELIIQDHKGLSKLRNHISDPNVLLLEGNDTGIAEANNLGAQQAGGQYLMFWGAGELAIMPGFMNAIEKLRTNPVDILFNCIRLHPINQAVIPTPHRIEQDMSCMTPGAMISKELFFRCGLLNPNYPIAADYAMFVSLLKATTNYIVTQDVVVDFPMNGVSTVERAFEGYIECELIRMREHNEAPFVAALNLIEMCRNYVKHHAKR